MATWVKIDENIEISPKNKKKFTLKEAQKYVDGYVELLYFPDNTMFICNEEGIIKDFPYNHVATEILKTYFGDKVQKIYGNVVWCNQNEF